jgi:hypothetical protein
MPFESSNNMVEMDNVLNGIYSFDENYWCDVSDSGIYFIF